MYYENAAFVCLVFDVSNRDSFESCGRWLQGVRAALPAASAPLPGVLIANKVDLREGGVNSRAVIDSQVSRKPRFFLSDRRRVPVGRLVLRVFSYFEYRSWQYVPVGMRRLVWA